MILYTLVYVNYLVIFYFLLSTKFCAFQRLQAFYTQKVILYCGIVINFIA